MKLNTLQKALSLDIRVNLNIIDNPKVGIYQSLAQAEENLVRAKELVREIKLTIAGPAGQGEPERIPTQTAG